MTHSLNLMFIINKGTSIQVSLWNPMKYLSSLGTAASISPENIALFLALLPPHLFSEYFHNLRT